MKKRFAFIVILLVLATTWAGIDLLGGEIVQAQPGLESNAISASAVPAKQAVEPDIPRIVDLLDFGVPAGNGVRPQKLALDSQRSRLYTLNQGLTSAGQGQTISVIDLEGGRVVALAELDNAVGPDGLAPMPLDLQLDPYRPRLYALTGDRFAESAAANTLTIVDTETLAVVGTLPGVDAFVPGPDRLYLANESRLWAVDPDSLAELAGQALEPRQYNEPLRLDAEANRLYLGRGRPWAVDIFVAETLVPLNSYAVTGDLAELRLDPTNQRLLLVSGKNDGSILTALDLDGRPLASLPPISLESFVYSVPPLAVTGDFLYLVDSTPDYDYELKIFRQPELILVRQLPLPSRPNDLVADPDLDLLYAAYSSPDSYVLIIDPVTGETQPIFTALDVVDALADPASGQLYVLDNYGTLQLLELSSYQPLDRVETGLRTTFDSLGYAGQLSLDPTRQRLYLSGDPVRTVDTQNLAVTTHADLRGQITPDPGGEHVYLTQPCLCRQEQCNTLILAADTLTGSDTIFPPEDPLTAPCVTGAQLDDNNRLLYTSISNGIPGSNAGWFFSVFDLQTPSPEQIYTAPQISYGELALDRLNGRAFGPRYRMDRSFLHRFDLEAGRTMTQSIELVGAQGYLSYDSTRDRLYAVDGDRLQVFDGELALLAEITLRADVEGTPPGEFWPRTFDPEGQRLYLADETGHLLVVGTDGGQLEPPPPADPPGDRVFPQKLVVAPDGARFRIDEGGRLYRSLDGGQGWQLLGTGLPGRTVNDVALSPTFAADQTLLAGLWHFGRNGGLFRSTDGGDTWRPTTRGLTDLEIQQIVYSPTFSRDQTIFLTTLDQGLFRSTDGGESWAPLADRYTADTFDRDLSHLAVSPAYADDGLVIIGHQHLLRSTDGGETWLDTGLPPGRVAFSPDFAGDGLVLSDGRWRSTDDGQTWQPAAAGLEAARTTQDIFFSLTFPVDQTVYLLQQSGLQRSVDAGQSWQSLLGGLPEGFEPAAATVLPGGELYLSDTAGQLLTVDPATLQWGRRPVDITQIDLQDLAIAPGGNIFVANSAAGLFKSTDGGRTWQDVDYPVRANEFQPARLAAGGEGTLLAAAGSAIERTADGGTTWVYLPNLPRGFVVASLAVSPNFGADGIVLAGGDYRQNQLLRSTDGGDTWQVVFDGSTVEGSSDVNLIAFSPNFAADGEAYAWLLQGGLLHSTDAGRSWTLVDSEQSSYSAQAMAISPDGEKLYVGALYGHLLVSTDRGRSWIELGDRIPGNRVWSSAIAVSGDGAIFLGTDIGVYRSLDEGQSWSEASAGLPLNPTYNSPPQVRVLRFDGVRLYATLTEGGLFVSTDRGQTWQSTLSSEATSPANLNPTPTPTPTPQRSLSAVECPIGPTYFAGLWSDHRVGLLGCPTDGRRVMMAEQLFEGGRMFWRSDIASIYALPANQPYARFDDTWDDSQPAYGCPEFGPSETPPTPQRGFGKVWCNNPSLREALGNATGAETLDEANVQEFEDGLIFQPDGGAVYMLEFGSNGWERVE